MLTNTEDVRVGAPKPGFEEAASVIAKWKRFTVGLAIASIVLLCTSVALAIALGVTYTQKDSDPVCGVDARSSFPATALTLSASELRASIFNDLTAAEVTSITTALLANASLSLVPAVNATVDSNFIAFMERFAPKKAEALAYLDDTTGTAPLPGRYARVLVHRGADAVPVAVEYKVGPLPWSASSQVHLYKTVPFSKRIVDDAEYNVMDGMIMDFAAQIDTVLQESYGATYSEECDPCLTYTGTLC